ncbi:YraN family protein [Treponema maltophilum]|uniref:YraN family protein n=1 Tax=Treponema maltophilum TaxID=51160 RepID=UPI003D91C04D
MSTDNIQKGKEGEKKAENYLKEQGYVIVCRNWRARRGEIDLIAEKDGTLVFAEVKTLPASTLETVEHVLGGIKQKKIIETAKRFLLENRQYSNSYIRFDVLIVDVPFYPPVYHIKNAFSEFV